MSGDGHFFLPYDHEKHGDSLGDFRDGEKSYAQEMTFDDGALAWEYDGVEKTYADAEMENGGGGVEREKEGHVRPDCHYSAT